MSRGHSANLMRASRAALPVAGAAGCCIPSCLVGVLAGTTEAALLLPLLLAVARALRLAVFLSLLLAAVTGMAELAGCAEGVERAIVDSELATELRTEVLSGTDSLAAASTWQPEQILIA